MEHIIYIRNNCYGCERIVEEVEDKNLSVTIINLDEADTQPPKPIQIFPALFKGNKLLAYGGDIINVLTR